MRDYEKEEFQIGKTFIANIFFFLYWIIIITFMVFSFNFIETLSDNSKVMGLLIFVVAIIEMIIRIPRVRLIFEEVVE